LRKQRRNAGDREGAARILRDREGATRILRVREGGSDSIQGQRKGSKVRVVTGEVGKGFSKPGKDR